MAGKPKAFELRVLPDRLAVCRLEPNGRIPVWANTAGFFAVVRAPTDLTVVCAEASVPETARAERGWRALHLQGVHDFAQVGVLAALCAPIADAGVSIMALSTFDTDYILVKADALAKAAGALNAAGHKVDLTDADIPGPGDKPDKASQKD